VIDDAGERTQKRQDSVRLAEDCSATGEMGFSTRDTGAEFDRTRITVATREHPTFGA